MRAFAAVMLISMVGLSCGRSLQAPTPTEALNAQRQQQQQQQRQQAAPVRRLQPPCYVPASYYPFRTCEVSTDAGICARGFNAWSTYRECCAIQRGPVGAFPAGCSDLDANVTCWTAGQYYPTRACAATSDLSICSQNWGQWKTQEQCCAAGKAFEEGCDKPAPCWVASAWYPSRTCGLTEDQSICQRGWGAFASEEACCDLGAAFSDGCGAVQAVPSA